MTKERFLFASLIGTTIEYFDFYIYGTAAVLVFPQQFFPAGNPTAATLQSLAELLPTTVRYTGACLTFNLAGILGGCHPLACGAITAQEALFGSRGPRSDIGLDDLSTES